MQRVRAHQLRGLKALGYLAYLSLCTCVWAGGAHVRDSGCGNLREVHATAPAAGGPRDPRLCPAALRTSADHPRIHPPCEGVLPGGHPGEHWLPGGQGVKVGGTPQTRRLLRSISTACLRHEHPSDMSMSQAGGPWLTGAAHKGPCMYMTLHGCSRVGVRMCDSARGLQ